MAKANAIKATEKTHTTKIYDIESLFQVFESWIQSMKTKPNMGIPIGFNWTTVNLEFEYKDKSTYDNYSKNETTKYNLELNLPLEQSEN